MLNDELNRIRERHANATPGPWTTEASGKESYRVIADLGIAGLDRRIMTARSDGRRSEVAIQANAEFIAHSWEDILYLLNLVAQNNGNSSEPEATPSPEFEIKYQSVEDLIGKNKLYDLEQQNAVYRKALLDFLRAYGNVNGLDADVNEIQMFKLFITVCGILNIRPGSPAQVNRDLLNTE